ncbi:MAG: hypothetical protein CVU77_02150 [Elusimicrobia bacterium HGW-Elusimicrobia-1]|jgi:L-2-hydroxyglutarate oxidase LhgO|nr:MAG: hypothetical protein CVU77_02150 [Elusimicrobia bacterium HGW-Elusimicrobia-1]
MEKIPVTIIGGGVVGLAIARELSLNGVDGVYLFEKNPYLGDEQSGRNSCVLHAGVYYSPGSLKAKLCVQGNAMLYAFCDEHGVACFNTSKIIVAVDEAKDRMIDTYVERCAANGVKGVKKISSKEIIEIEPNVRALSALLVPSTGVLDVPEYVKTLARLASDAGAGIIKDTKVTGIEPRGDGFVVRTRDSRGAEDEFETDRIINSAGLYADEIAALVNPSNSWRIAPLRGEYYRYDSSSRKEVGLNGTCVYQVQEPYELDGKLYFGIGIHLTPTLDVAEGGSRKIGRYVSVGPTSIPVTDKHDYETGRKAAGFFYEDVKRFFPNLRVEDLQMDYAGNRAKLKGYDDFVIRRDEKYPACAHLVGIDSPGLTSSLAIARYVAEEFFDVRRTS